MELNNPYLAIGDGWATLIFCLFCFVFLRLFYFWILVFTLSPGGYFEKFTSLKDTCDTHDWHYVQKYEKKSDGVSNLPHLGTLGEGGVEWTLNAKTQKGIYFEGVRCIYPYILILQTYLVSIKANHIPCNSTIMSW